MIRYLECSDEDLVVMDTQAGLEPFGRGIAEGFRCALVVTDTTFNSLQVAERVGQLSRDLGIKDIRLVVNRYEPSAERKLEPLLMKGAFSSVHRLPLDPSLARHEPDMRKAIEEKGAYVRGVQELLHTIAP
jgi:CO dehydrogenase maturation factor